MQESNFWFRKLALDGFEGRKKQEAIGLGYVTKLMLCCTVFSCIDRQVF